jgi:uncharacterized protein YqgV (UPF0045/DUF77 family)
MADDPPRAQDWHLMALSYEIRVRGRVDDRLAHELGLRADVAPVETVLSGALDDLQDVLAQLQDLGLELVEIRRLPSDAT